MAILPEEINVKGLEQWLKKGGWYYEKNFGNRFTRSGVPDLIACIEGKFVGLEVKANKNGKPSDLQKYNREWINKCRGECFFVEDYRKAIERLERIIEEQKGLFGG